MITSPRLSPEQKQVMAREAAKLALDAASDVPGAAERARGILEQLRIDRRLVVGR